MNNTPEGKVEPHPFYAATFGCILLLGLPLNAVSLWILLRRHSLKSPSAVFMVNLALSDMLLATSLPMRVYFYATGTWPLGIKACNCITMFFRNNIRSSSIFITFISVDRLLAVVYPLRSRHVRTSANAWRAAVLVWLILLAVNVPESMNFSKRLHNYNKSLCFEFAQAGPAPSVPVICFQAVLWLVLLVVLIVCTAVVSWTLHKHLNQTTRISNRMNVMLIFVLNLAMFAVCFTPLTISAFTTHPESVKRALICLATANCCLDPLLYYFSMDAFWKKKQDVDPTKEESPDQQ
ncbi:lysophosphatidic acid receptor 6-like [Echeneis naucrates]|uniref:Lysophosphatidic acid receptor 6-like n=1 Tax=Echeneis naucrates TaxID=173247 RepID=A0A665VNW1_ECHNA|nr:lysophosphatidic acid receptor 6-like [Echeneis naucrates]